MKPRTKSRAVSERAVSTALSNIESAHTPLLALEAFGRQHIAVATLGMFGSFQSVAALCQKSLSALIEARSGLKVTHGAARPLTHACDALQSLERFMDLADASPEGNKESPSAPFARMVSDVILFFVADVGQSMERAEIALGQSPGYGYLENARNRLK